jgi:hypothetical protein
MLAGFASHLGDSAFLTTWASHTQNTENGITLSASSEFSASTAAWRGHGAGSWVASAGVDEWWQVQFEGYRRVTEILLTQDSVTCVFDVLGSNDGSNFTALGTVSSNNTPVTPASSVPWIYFRLLCTNDGAGSARFGEATFTFAAN